MNSLLKNPIFPEFIKISQQFVKDIHILEPKDMHDVRELIMELNKLGVFGASMNQLGKSVYCFCKHTEVKMANEVFNSFTPSFLKELEVCETGPILSRL